MPPKPWETKMRRNIDLDISKTIQVNAPNKEDVPTIPLANQKIGNSNQTNTNTSLGGTGSMGGLGGLGGYGSYGGLGSMYGGLGGGMYGGYGMGGLGMGMGGMYGQQPDSFLGHILKSLQSFGFLMQFLGNVGKTLETNIGGIKQFFISFIDFLVRIKDGIYSGIEWVANLFKLMFDFLKNKLITINNDDKGKTNKCINIILKICFVLLVISFYPVLRKMQKQLL